MLSRPARLAASTAALCVSLLSALPAAAQWVAVGAVGAPKRSGATLTFQNARTIVAITAVSPEIVRVRLSPTRTFGRDHSYAVVPHEWDDPGLSVATANGATTMTTRALKVTIRHAPFGVVFADGSGNSLDEDDPTLATMAAGVATRVHKRLRDDELVYGFGEKTGRLNKRAQWLGGYTYMMWNSDSGGYDQGIDPLYATIPFFVVLRQGRAHGIFLDNTWRSVFDVGKSLRGILSFGTDGGELNYYFIDGPTPKDVIRRYTELTGRMPLPPVWSLGFHQCRYSYYPESQVRFIADNFRLRRIPADTLWLDIHYLENYNPLTWDKTRFPDPAKMIADLRQQGFHVVTILDPHPAKKPGWDVYDSGIAGDHFVKRPDGTVYEAPVWPSKSETSPANSVFPDFSRPATREWWGGLYKRLTDVGVAGIWNDMNEPAVFKMPLWTMDLDARHDNEGQPTSHLEIHNVWGQLMTRSTYEGLLKLRPDERPFVLTRATYAGGQRYSALWPGDNQSRWEDLRQSVPMLLNLGLSGLGFVGSDIGGFGESATAELFTRWLQLGVFYPFMRAHTSIDTDNEEPWVYGPAFERINRRAIELRYELLPHVYNEVRLMSETGIPAMRPVFLEFPDDPQTYTLDDEFMFGRDLLVAPVLFEARQEREVYLPKGTWFDVWSGKAHDGGASVRLPVTLESIPVFAREGAFIFRQPVVQHTGQMPGQPLRVMVFPAAESEATLYEDDGHSMAYRGGASLRRRFAQTRTSDTRGTVTLTLDVDAAEGSYRPQARALEWHVHWTGVPQTVRVEGSGTAAMTLTRAPSLDALAKADAGWTVDEQGFVVIRMQDRFDAFRVTVD
jgi:alpha-glucosidase